MKGNIVALARKVRAVSKVGESGVATSRGKKRKKYIAVIRGLKDDEEARVGGKVGGFMAKEMGESRRKGSGKVVENAKG